MGKKREKRGIPYYTQCVIDYYFEFSDKASGPKGSFEEMTNKELRKFIAQYMDTEEYRSLEDWFRDNQYHAEFTTLGEASSVLADEDEEDITTIEALEFFEEWDFHVYSKATLAYYTELTEDGAEEADSSGKNLKTSINLKKVF